MEARQLGPLLARRVVDARTQRGWSLSRLARETGLSEASVSVIERGDGNVTLHTLERLADALDVDPCEFLCPEDQHH